MKVGSGLGQATRKFFEADLLSPPPGRGGAGILLLLCCCHQGGVEGGVKVGRGVFLDLLPHQVHQVQGDFDTEHIRPLVKMLAIY